MHLPDPKKLIVSIAALIVGFGQPALAQRNEWTWIGGSSATRANSGPAPVYGQLGVPAAENTPGGRAGGANWADRKGNLWLFSGGTAGPNDLPIEPNDLWMFNSSTSQWTWAGGNTVVGCGQVVTLCGNPGVYGTLGIPAPGNMPGSRHFTKGAVDPDGNFWMFGGVAEDAHSVWGALNDLWMYNPTTAQWTWMSGSDDAHCCAGINGVYGTLGTSAPGNVPGGRLPGAVWVDKKGNFWLFGGLGNDAAFNRADLNDMWKFDPSIKEWTWMGGSEVGWGQPGRPGTYGTRGIPSHANIPGSRTDATAWTDSAGNLWLFGGEGYDSRNTGGKLNDLRKYDTGTNEWTWMAGSSVTPCLLLCGQPGVYGQLGVSDAANMPGGRFGATPWPDSNDNFWLFGGKGMDVNGQFGFLDDLWVYISAAHEWRWMGGNTFTSNCFTYEEMFTYCGGLGGSYGKLGTPGAGNLPGSRASGYSWVDGNGDLLLFGGVGFDRLDANGSLNDVWRYTPSLSDLPPVPMPILGVPSGTYSTGGELPIVDAMPSAVIHYTTDGSTPTENASIYIEPIAVLASETVKARASAAGYPSSGVATAVYVILPPSSTPVFSPAGGAYTAVQSVTIRDATPNATIYYTIDGSTPSGTSKVYGSPISVASSETIKAIATAGGYSTSAVAAATYTINLPPPSFALTSSPASLTVSSGGNGTTVLTITPQNDFNAAVTFACSGLPVGASCSFNPATVTPSGVAATTTMTILTAKKSAALTQLDRSFLPIVAFVIGVGIFSLRRARPRSVMLLVALSMSGLGLLSACGGGAGSISPGSDGSNPVTYTTTVTATSGSLRQTATIALTVN